MLIAFAGQKRSGKDTAASALTEHGFTSVAFADKVRESVATLNPIIGSLNGWGEVRLSEAFAEGWTWETIYGNTASPYDSEVRRLLQFMGTDVGRNILGENCWVEIIQRRIREEGLKKVAISDCRFINEAQWVHDVGGTVVRILRPATDDPNPVHASEIIDFPCDITIVNDGTLEEFVGKVIAAAMQL